MIEPKIAIGHRTDIANIRGHHGILEIEKKVRISALYIYHLGKKWLKHLDAPFGFQTGTLHIYVHIFYKN